MIEIYVFTDMTWDNKPSEEMDSVKIKVPEAYTDSQIEKVIQEDFHKLFN